MLCACFIRTLPCNAHPGCGGGGGVERPCGQRNTIVRCQPRQARTPDARRQTRRVFRLTRIACPLNEMEDAPGLREELVGGMDVCLILSQRIERNKPRRGSRPARGLGGPLPLYRRQLSSQPYQNHKPVCSFIHTSIQVPDPTTTPRSCPEFVRPPDRPSDRCATFPSFTKIPHTFGLAAPVIPAPVSPCGLGDGWGERRSRMNIQSR